MERKYKFKVLQEESDFIYKKDDKLYKFYQICYFKNQNKYQVRRILFDGDDKILKTEIKNLSDKQMDKFKKTHSSFMYHIYSTHNINLIDLPNSGDLVKARSILLNNNSNYTGFAQF